MTDYAHPDMVVSTAWVAEHGQEPGVRLIEVGLDRSSYESGHIENAVGWNWETQLCDPLRRDVLSKTDIEALFSSAGVTNDTTLVFYGDNGNWFAAYALWQACYWGHGEDRLRLMNGGRMKWIAEGRPLTTTEPTPPRAAYRARFTDDNVRAYTPHILAGLADGRFNLVDVRSVPEYVGDVVAPEGMTETAQRAGHIPTAVNIPWYAAVEEDGTFKAREELERIYGRLDEDKETVVYCRIGERSSHTWFVLRYLLGYEKVRNYDGSWTEWGNLIGVPIARGSE
jgi:thiosulfate/3-mercaptopyruvate sulfurtransferase